MIVNCFFILEIYRHHGQSSDICFLDQGICQALLSLGYNSKTENFPGCKLATSLNFLSTHGSRIIYINTDVSTVVSRLKGRREKQSRLESIKDMTDFAGIIRTEKQRTEHLLTVLCAQLKTDINTIQTDKYENIHAAAQQIADLFADSC